MASKTEAYQPLATAVPAEDGNLEEEILTVASVAESAPEEANSLRGLTEQQSRLRAQVPAWTDTYFDGREDVWGVFDFDSQVLISNSRKLNTVYLVIFLVFAFPADMGFPCFFIGCFLFWNAQKSSVGTHTTRHLALTRNGVLFVHEKHRCWYGMKGHHEVLVPWEDMNHIGVQHASGDVVVCFECSISKIKLQQHLGICDESVLLDVAGIREAKALVKILRTLRHHQIRGNGPGLLQSPHFSLEVPLGNAP